MPVLSPAVSLMERIAIAVLLGVPADVQGGNIVLLVLALGAIAEVVLRWLDRRTSVRAIHRAAELPAQTHVPTDAELLALLRRRGIGPRDLAAAWKGCKPDACAPAREPSRPRDTADDND